MATPHAAANRILVTEPERCTGCGFCEMACAITQDHTCDPGRSRVRIIEWKDGDRYLPVTCQHCEDAPCMKVCPREAIHRDGNLERVNIDYNLCISCRMCASACPYGAIGFNDKRGRVFKCDLCEGDPQCRGQPDHAERRGFHRQRRNAGRRAGPTSGRDQPETK